MGKSSRSSRTSKSSRSFRSISKNIIDKSDPRDPIYHLAQCLFYSVHLINISKVQTDRLNAGSPQLLIVLMHDSEVNISKDPMKYLNECFRLFTTITKEYFNFEEYIEILMRKFMLEKLIPKMAGSNYVSLFSTVFNRACVNYIGDLRNKVPSLYIYDNPDIYKNYCVELFKSCLVTAFESTVHRMVDNRTDDVPRELYESVRAHRDKLAKKYKKLKKKYNHLKRELE